MVSPWVGLVYALLGCATALYVGGVRIQKGKVVHGKVDERTSWTIAVLWIIASIIFYLLIPNRQWWW